jgi:hypothetical protein
MNFKKIGFSIKLIDKLYLFSMFTLSNDAHLQKRSKGYSKTYVK